MDRKLINMAYYIPLSIPIFYFGMLFFSASIYYQSYYGRLTQIPFSFYSLLWGGVLSIAALGTTYFIAYHKEQELIQEQNNQTNALQTRLEGYQVQLQETEREKQEQNNQINALQTRLEGYQVQLQEADRMRQELIQRHTEEIDALQARLETCESRFTQERQKHQSLLAEFLGTQDLAIILNSDLLTGLHQKGCQITKVKKLTGGYSGAQVYSFYRQGENVPGILKVTNKREIKNEYQKFKDHVEGRLLNGPNVCHNYLWGQDAGLESSLKWNVPGCDHLTLSEIYKECLKENTTPGVEVNTIVQGIIERLLKELQDEESWWRPDLINVPPPVNIYQEHYPFTRKFVNEIDPLVRKYLAGGRTTLALSTSTWNQYEDALVETLLSPREWNRRKNNNNYLFNIVRATIHGDLNSRNILLDASRKNHNVIHTIGLVDFSHTGNGLTIKQTDNYIRDRIQLDRNQGHIANDFCRLEADIKFYLTDLNDMQDLKRAWIIECLLLQQGLDLLDWEELQKNDSFKKILEGERLSKETKWKELTDSSCWTEENARKFFLAWQSIKVIRDVLRKILKDQLPQGGILHRQPFYLALLQATLTMIYYEDERFHNADLQKLYMVLASALLCKQLL